MRKFSEQEFPLSQWLKWRFRGRHILFENHPIQGSGFRYSLYKLKQTALSLAQFGDFAKDFCHFWSLQKWEPNLIKSNDQLSFPYYRKVDSTRTTSKSTLLKQTKRGQKSFSICIEMQAQPHFLFPKVSREICTIYFYLNPSNFTSYSTSTAWSIP